MKKPLAIAFITGQLGLGGSEQQLYYLLSGLVGTNFQPIVINLAGRPDEHWVEPIKSLGVPLWHVNRSWGRAGRTFQITNILRSKRVQIVHGWGFFTNPYSALSGRLAGVPLRLGSMREEYHGIPGTIVRRAGYRGLDLLVTNSVAATRHIHEFRLTKAPVRTVPNGVTIPELVTQDERERLRRKLGLSNADLVIGSVGRLHQTKNHAMLLRVLARLEKKWPALRLVIIGDGPMRQELHEISQQLNLDHKVFLPGAIPQAAQYLPALDVCCLASTTGEGMPNLLMESAASALPVISTDCGGSSEVIEHGVTGFLVAVNDEEGVAAHLDMLLGKPEQRRRMGESGRKRMQREFSIQSMSANMIHVYEEAHAVKGLS